MQQTNSIKSTLQSNSSSERVLSVTIPKAQVESAYRKAFQEKRKHLKLKGFRKGKVPESIAKQHLTDAHLVRRVVNLLVPPAYKEALKQHKLSPLGKPDWELKESHRGKDLVFEATLHVMPLLEFKRHRKFPIQKPAPIVSKSQVHQLIEQRRQSAARYLDRPADHKAVLGDFAFIDYRAEHRGRELPNSEVKNFLLEMNHEKFLPGFVEQLLGIGAGETRLFAITMPVGYADRNLAGEEVRFEVKVHQLKERRIPEFNDEFVKQFTKLSTVKEFTDAVESNLKAQTEKRSRDEITNEIVKSLVGDIELSDVPLQLQDGHARLALRTQTNALERKGVTMEQHLSSRGISSEHFGEEVRLTGLVEARLEILYRSIAAAENIAVLKKEVDQAIIQEAKQSGQSAKELKQRMLKEDTYKLLAYRLLIGKVRSWLFENADITYIDPTATKKKVKTKAKPAAKKKKVKTKAKPAAKKKNVKAKAKPAAKKKKVKAKAKPAAKKKKVKVKAKPAAKKKVKIKAKPAAKKKKKVKVKAKPAAKKKVKIKAKPAAKKKKVKVKAKPAAKKKKVKAKAKPAAKKKKVKAKAKAKPVAKKKKAKAKKKK